jgi:hypothetical protein
MRVDASLPLRRLGLGGLLLAACQAPIPPTRETESQPRTPPTGSQVPGRHTRLGSWRECSGRRDHPAWGKQRVACVAVGLAGPETASPEAMTFALLVATPARRLSWPRVRVTRPKESWRGRLISNASE